MSLELSDPQQSVEQITQFLRQRFTHYHKTKAVIAVSGGIDSAVALTLLTKALGSESVIPVLLPYAEQLMTDAETLLSHMEMPASQVVAFNIQPMVQAAAQTLDIPEASLRLGNVQARMRMIAVFDVAKRHQALVCGTENKSEHYLGYFTRFGDAASDLEPLTHLYKTQVRQLALALELPPVFLTKPPSAGLWPDQTDEQELGFSYEVADQVLSALIDEHQAPASIQIPGVSPELVLQICQRVEQMQFKREVPYIMTKEMYA